TNVFCALLIPITRPFRQFDHIELVESGDKPGLRGRGVDMNPVYVTLQDTHPGGGVRVLRVPNSLYFQRAARRWRGAPPPRVEARPATGDSGSPGAVGGGGSSVVGNFP